MATIYEKENSYYTLKNAWNLHHKKLLLIKNQKKVDGIERKNNEKNLYILNEIKYFKKRKIKKNVERSFWSFMRVESFTFK